MKDTIVNLRYKHESLSMENRLRRSIYTILCDVLHTELVEYTLVDSYFEFRNNQLDYPFVEKRELKPRARIPDVEYPFHNSCLVIFLEDSIPTAHKKYIRFFNDNKVNKKNLIHSKNIPISRNFDRTLKFMDSPNFFDFLSMMLPVDYALLIEQDPALKSKNRYCLTYFHVRVDWPIADASEELARDLRYISKDLYEKGDRYAEDIQKKFFEFYGLPFMAGGRRTAAIVSAQYFKRLNFLSTIYAGSSESRCLFKISHGAVSKTILMELSDDDMNQLCETNSISRRTFSKNYLIDRYGKCGVGIFQTVYAPTIHSYPPEDGRLRDLNPDVFWITVDAQYLLPRPDVWKYPPLNFSVIYN
jgi:hypothetical protein